MIRLVAIILLFFLSQHINAQEIKVVDYITNKHIANTTITNGEIGVITNKKGQVNLNIKDLINRNYSFDQVKLESGLINIKYNKDGVSNFDIFKERNEKDKEFQIHEINLKDMNLKYNDKTRSDSSIIKIKDSRIRLFDQLSKLKIKGKFFITDLFLDSIRYINNEEIEVNSEFIISDNKGNLSKSTLNLFALYSCGTKQRSAKLKFPP